MNACLIDSMNELIETLWNVNYVGEVKKTFGVRINRNIVECKSLRWDTDLTLYQRINRNIVECK